MPSKVKIFNKFFGITVVDIMRVKDTPQIVNEWRNKFVEVTGRSRMQPDIDGKLGRWFECVRLDVDRPDEWTVGWLQEEHLTYCIRENQRRLKNNERR